jgi:hypothetical protein
MLIMQIVIGRTTNIHVDEFSKNSLNNTPKKKKNEDKRKNKQDRRKSVRDGVIVSLSFKKDRRVGKDRRRKI